MEYKLIMAVSGFPSLYDSSSASYRDLNMRAHAWSQVAQRVGVPELECRRKWKMLRDQHRRERQQERERWESAVGLSNYKPWRYSAMLSFLNPFIDARAPGTNGWALNPQASHLQASDPVGCSTTTETWSDNDENYGISVADATSSSSLELVQRKRLSSGDRDHVTLKEAKVEETLESAAEDNNVQMHPAQQVDMKELFEVMMQSVTSLATSLASSRFSSQPLDQQTSPKRSSLATAWPDPPEHLSVTHRPRHSSLLEEYLRKTDAQRDDATLLFLLSLAPAITRLPAEKQSWVRTKIQQLLHDAEFGRNNFR